MIGFDHVINKHDWMKASLQQSFKNGKLLYLCGDDFIVIVVKKCELYSSDCQVM